MSVYGYWILPDGSYRVIQNQFGHKKFIEDYFNTKFNSDEDATEASLKEGWIRIVNGSQMFMVDYRYIMCQAQLKAIKEIDDILQDNGCYHQDYFVTHGYEYFHYKNVKQLINHIINRDCK